MKKQPEFWDGVFEDIANGAALSDVAKIQDVKYTNLFRTIHHDGKLEERYDSARRSRALVHAGRIEKLVDDVEAGSTPADAGRVVLAGRQWLASRMDPKHWGEQIKVQQDVRVQDVTALHLEAVRNVMQNMAKGEGAVRDGGLKDEAVRDEAMRDEGMTVEGEFEVVAPDEPTPGQPQSRGTRAQSSAPDKPTQQHDEPPEPPENKAV